MACWLLIFRNAQFPLLWAHQYFYNNLFYSISLCMWSKNWQLSSKKKNHCCNCDQGDGCPCCKSFKRKVCDLFYEFMSPCFKMIILTSSQVWWIWNSLEKNRLLVISSESWVSVDRHQVRWTTLLKALLHFVLPYICVLTNTLQFKRNKRNKLCYVILIKRIQM